MNAPQLLAVLKKQFGYSSFRPLQEEIIRDTLAGKDVFALLPTGGGKSLCFQLPALIRPGLTVVISPLIALMKDQVDGLQTSGIAATFLNSTLKAGDSRERLRDLHNGKYRLLYLAPERVMLSGMLDDLQRWKVSLIAIDEAHCISEWGHDFRPDYRQLSQLRNRFPAVPIMALTATATERVRQDVVTQLRLREPRCYVASFNRPNLSYRVLPKERPYDQLLEFLGTRRKESGIVYCQSRKNAEEVAKRLSRDGFAAKPYHAGLEKEQRTKNQDLFLRDEVRIICATIAFGMGINKPNVRYIVHYDLPKNVEGYYQETGRAGRDGLPSDCLLLFGAGDVAKHFKFINEKPNPKEQQIARQQLQQMVRYGDNRECRRAFLLRYFGETYAAGNCEACDNCLSPRETYDATVLAQKFLSCVYRVKEKSRFGVGMAHIIEVLTGADTEKLRKWGHHELSTYGIGRECNRTEWAAIGRELIRLGYLRQLAERFNILELTEEGRQVLTKRQPVLLSKSLKPPEKSEPAIGEISCDEELFDRLRQLRKQLADQRGVTPDIVFSDVTLRQMARFYPQSVRELHRLSGMSQKKLEDFGAAFLAEINAYLRDHPKQIFADELRKTFSTVERSRDKESEGPYDVALFERLREVRKRLAKEKGVSAFIIFYDSTLREICREYPLTSSALASIKNVGNKKATEFGPHLLPEIKAHVQQRACPVN